MKILSACAALIMLLALTAAAQEQTGTGTLKGKLQDEKGKPIANAEVSIECMRDRSVRKANTNDSGEYSFEAPADEYIVSFKADGYEEGTLQAMQQIEEGKVTTVKTIKLPKATHSSLIRGAVFDMHGRAISGVQIKLVRVAATEEEKAGKHFKSLSKSYTSNKQGEFAFRLPSQQARYQITASAPGFRTDMKVVDVNEDESVPVALTLIPVKKD